MNLSDPTSGISIALPRRGIKSTRRGTNARLDATTNGLGSISCKPNSWGRAVVASGYETSNSFPARKGQQRARGTPLAFTGRFSIVVPIRTSSGTSVPRATTCRVPPSFSTFLYDSFLLSYLRCHPFPRFQRTTFLSYSVVRSFSPRE